MAFSVTEFANEQRAALEHCDRRYRCAFGAACGERLFPYFARVHDDSGRGDVSAIRDGLDLIWTGLDRGRFDARGARRASERCAENIFEAAPA